MRESRLENIGLLMEYEEILLKKRKDFTSSYMGKATLQKSACSVFRFAFEDILGWTPEMVRDYTTPELMNILHLRKPLNRIEFPPELDKRTDLFYLAWMMYPDTIHINQKQLVLRVYEKVRQGIVMKFPKNFFSEANGLLNANICLQYAINRDLVFKNIQELYEYFSDRLQAVAFLKECKLYAPCCEFYEYPIDYLHHSLPDAERNSLYYHFGRFLTDLEEIKGGSAA